MIAYLAMLTKWSGFPVDGFTLCNSRSIQTTTVEEPDSRRAARKPSSFSKVISTKRRHKRQAFSKEALP